MLPGAHHGWAKYFADNREFETLSAPASLAATLHGVTFCVAAPPAAPLADDTDKRKKSATEQIKAQVILLTIPASHVIHVIRGSASALLIMNG